VFSGVGSPPKFNGDRDILLRTVRLGDELVAAPTVDLWPAVRVRAAVPDDVREELLAPLADADRSTGA